jgi:hypothetical protein
LLCFALPDFSSLRCFLCFAPLCSALRCFLFSALLSFLCADLLHVMLLSLRFARRCSDVFALRYFALSYFALMLSIALRCCQALRASLLCALLRYYALLPPRYFTLLLVGITYVLSCILLRSTAICCIVLHCAALCCIVLHSAAIYRILLHSAAFYRILLHSAI